MIRMIASALQARDDEAKILVSLLLHIPMSYIYNQLPVRKNTEHFKQDILKRQLFGLFIGLSTLFWILETYEIIISIISYALFYFLSFKCQNPKITFYLNFVNFSILIISHVHRMVFYYNQNIYNLNFLLMQTVPKQMYFNLFIHNLLKSKDMSAEKRRELIPEIDESIINEQEPSFFDYVCYLLNFNGIVAGPLYSYTEYLHFIHQTFPEIKNKSKVINEKIFTLFICIFIYILSISYWDFDIIKTTFFANQFLPIKALIIYFQSFFNRLRYYTPFLLAEFTYCLSNFLSSGKNYEAPLTNINIIGIEFSFSTKKRVASWNMGIAQWLRMTIYNPSMEVIKFNRNQATLFTFFISSLWHGFYPSYYVGFFFGNLSVEIEKLIFRNENLKFVPLILSSMVLDYGGMIFKYFEVNDTIAALKNTWIFPVFYIVLYVGLSYYPKKINKKND